MLINTGRRFVTGANSLSELPSELLSLVRDVNRGETKIDITTTNIDNKPTFKFRASTVGKKVDVVPILSSYPEKCNTPPCYYLIDDFSPDNEQSSAFLYVPETEDA